MVECFVIVFTINMIIIFICFPVPFANSNDVQTVLYSN